MQEPEGGPWPDTFEKQNGTENSPHDSEEYTRSLLSEEELIELEKEGYWTIEAVRDFIKQNIVKESMDARGEIYELDPEILMLIDLRTNYKIFIAGDNIYTREELIECYPFQELKTVPENVFTQQEIGVFPPKKWAINSTQWEYITRDVGDEDQFIMLEDMVGKAARFNYKHQRPPKKIVKTKVYFGREAWEDFSMLRRLLRGVSRCLALENGDSVHPLKALSYLFSNKLLLRDSEGVHKEQIEREEREKRRREEELRRREEELRAREQELHEKQEEMRSLEERIGFRTTMFHGASIRAQNRKKAERIRKDTLRGKVTFQDKDTLRNGGTTDSEDSIALPFGPKSLNEDAAGTESEEDPEDDLEGIIGELLSFDTDN